MNGSYHRHRAVVDRGKRRVTAAIGADQTAMAFARLDLLDVHACVEAATFRAQHHDTHARVFAKLAHALGEVEPVAHPERVDRWFVHHHFGDARFDARGND